MFASGTLVNMLLLTLDIGCGKHKWGDIGVDYSRNSDADINFRCIFPYSNLAKIAFTICNTIYCFRKSRLLFTVDRRLASFRYIFGVPLLLKETAFISFFTDFSDEL